MPRFSQSSRPFRVATPLARDELVLQRFEGEEGLSTPYTYTLELLSDEKDVDPDKLLRQHMTIAVDLPDQTVRHIDGIVRKFEQLGQVDDVTFYRAEIVPWFWFLTLSRDRKIFQNMTVLEIAQEVFRGLTYSDFELRCTQTYDPREFCVQYDESHFNFVSRLFEEEGIFYFFEHSDGKHVLVIADDASAHAPCPGQASARLTSGQGSLGDEDEITSLTLERSVHIGKVSLTDYDYLQPSLNLLSTVSGEKGEEIYEYPGRYSELADGGRYAALMLELGESGGQLVSGEANCRSFQSGFRFDLEDHYRDDANQSYLLLQVRHWGEAGDYFTWDTAALEYRCQFLAMPYATPFRPPRGSRRPRIHGSQTAVVVGKSGEEIWTEEHGRVKVQFYWDRIGSKDEKSSCWVRVATAWAGKAWGSIHIPRIGQEVIVEFLEGDPDRPIITGRVYNADQTVPYSLPANQTQSGLKSRSTKGGGGDNFNEIRMEDKKGSEQLYIHAEKDKVVMVENDRTETVGNDETIDIGKDRTETVGNDETITIMANRTETVHKNESITVYLNRTRKVGINEAVAVAATQEVTVGAKRNVTVGLNQTTNIGKDLSESVGGDASHSVGKSRTTEIGKDDKLKVGKKLLIEAGDEITIKTGKASIVMKKDGTVNISGKDITVKASGNIVMKGKKILQN